MIKDRLGSKFHYYIWYIMLIRLLLPYAPNTSISLFNLFHYVHLSEPYVNNQTMTNQIEPIINTDSFPMEEVDSINYLPELMQILMTIWIIGMIAILAYTFIVNIQFREKWREDAIEAEPSAYKILEECKCKMGMKKNAPIFYTKAIHAPVLYGLFYPTLLLPMNSKEVWHKDEMTCIMLHELSHLKRKDIAVFWIMTIIKSIHWFNPIVWYGLHRMRQDSELACDALALSYLNEKDTQKYGYTIIHMLQKTQQMGTLNVAGMTGNKSQIIRRVKMIALFKKNSYKLSFVAILILIIMGCMFLTNAAEDKVPQQTPLESQPETQKEAQVGTVEMLWPLDDGQHKRITSGFGWKKHPIKDKKYFHEGIDIAARQNTKIIAVSKGVVICSDSDEQYGKNIKIQHDNGIVTFYAHCSKLLMNKGDTVEPGEEIAQVGSTGMSTGPHLHFEVQKNGEPVDPLDGYLSVSVIND